MGMDKKKIKNQNKTLKKPSKTYNDSTAETCNIGQIKRKGYTKKIKNKVIHVQPTCVKNKREPDNLINKNSKIQENLKMEKYISNIHKTSYKSVILKLKSQLKKKDLNNTTKKELQKDIELLEKWRKNNPNKKSNDKKL